MLFSRPLWNIAVCSCAAHILVLGLAEVVKLTAVRSAPNTLKVALHFRPAVPLPVGNPGAPGAGAPPPVPEPTQAVTPAPPKPPSQPKPRMSRPAAAKPKPPPNPQPAVIAAPAATDAPPLPAWPSLPENTAREGGTEAIGSSAEARASNGTGAGGSGGKAGAGVGGGSGHGGGGGTSAHPDYGVNPKPPYPLLARRIGMQGTVVLRVHVRADGSVAEAELARSSGSQLLDDSALKTVRERWRFLPARLDGAPVESWVEVPIRFVLDVS